ncbi:HIT family protein [Paenibacillus ihumii]|uniref:HIT family protein n=1 Tax=Paenibacillus ihumii TaxID=687436 RepID=UPI001E55A244|nr:HIT domain-containing protein [Paenibacillus ihumii]
MVEKLANGGIRMENCLIREVKIYLDRVYKPQGYNLGWNCGEVGGQHIFHSHLHIIPRYKDESLAGKGIRYMFKNPQNERNHCLFTKEIQ